MPENKDVTSKSIQEATTSLEDEGLIEKVFPTSSENELGENLYVPQSIAVFDTARVNETNVLGRINIVMAGRGGDQIGVQGAFLSLNHYVLRRDELLKIVSTPTAFRTGHFEFMADAASLKGEGIPNRDFCFEVMYVAQESLMAIGVELVYWPEEEEFPQAIPAHPAIREV